MNKEKEEEEKKMLIEFKKQLSTKKQDTEGHSRESLYNKLHKKYSFILSQLVLLDNLENQVNKAVKRYNETNEQLPDFLRNKSIIITEEE